MNIGSAKLWLGAAALACGLAAVLIGCSSEPPAAPTATLMQEPTPTPESTATSAPASRTPTPEVIDAPGTPTPQVIDAAGTPTPQVIDAPRTPAPGGTSTPTPEPDAPAAPTMPTAAPDCWTEEEAAIVGILDNAAALFFGIAFALPFLQDPATVEQLLADYDAAGLDTENLRFFLEPQARAEYVAAVKTGLAQVKQDAQTLRDMPVPGSLAELTAELNMEDVLRDLELAPDVLTAALDAPEAFIAALDSPDAASPEHVGNLVINAQAVLEGLCASRAPAP